MTIFNFVVFVFLGLGGSGRELVALVIETVVKDQRRE